MGKRRDGHGGRVAGMAVYVLGYEVLALAALAAAACAVGRARVEG